MKKLLYFSADWCQPCKQLGPMMEKISQQIPTQKINVDTNPELQARYGVRNVPTVILQVDNVEKGRKLGLNPKNAYIDLYNQV